MEKDLPERPVLTVRLRARVRHRGLAGRAQTLQFHVEAGDTVEVALAVTSSLGEPAATLAGGALDAGTSSKSAEKREHEAQRP